MAREPETLVAAGSRELEGAGFTKAEILEMIGIAASWSFNTTLATLVDAGLREDA